MLLRKLLNISGLLCLFLLLSCNGRPRNHVAVDYKLFLVGNERRPIVVSFGGSEGGMVYYDKETQNLRDSILSIGYHVLAVGYFGSPNTPNELNRISLDAIYDTIKSISQQPLIDQDRIVIFGS